MTSDPSSLSAHSSAARGAPVLDGEVMPPLRTPRSEPKQAPRPAASPKAARRLSLGLAVAGGLAIAAASGGVALEGYRWHLRTLHVAAASGANATALAKLGKDVGDLKSAVVADRQDDTLKALRKTVDQLRGEVDGLRSANAAATAQLAAKLESKPATPPAMTEVVSRLDRIDHDPRLGEIASRLDRIEHQVASPAPTGSIVPAKPATQATTVQANAAPTGRAAKPAVLDNWIVRDVYSGIALVEGRSGSVREVVPGEVLPGAGEVQAIQRRGRGWIVVTSRGIIDTETW
ncbi:hypothetical protein P7D22_08230 [Lichenihabitans sp. Uapishka_5]|uniref:hypothetical protein n=1 Tax=Lichenihabitans sp. Uapishka_5 TaxID=3037302 RepID=UPI0029E81C5B|nr:hypothetical protein [Lichenihabitans sp. Uapishka_5]MDX7951167.1 hypothetical protein [Lichenihabitans sp. Uapishka_5]